MHDAPAGGELRRCGPVVGDVVIAGAEPTDVAGVTDQHRGQHGADAEYVALRIGDTRSDRPGQRHQRQDGDVIIPIAEAETTSAR